MEKHAKRKNKKMIILSILRIVFFIALVISIIYVVKWFVHNKQNKILEEKIFEAVIVEEDSTYKVDFKHLKEINEYVVCWLKVNGTQIEYPVVQAKDNSYYLNRNLNHKYNNGGWIFADYKNKLDGTDKNIIIYGHNMRNKSMFGTLKDILKEEWYNNKENYILDLVTESEYQKYHVFSVYQIKTEDYYIETEFKNNEFENFVEVLKNRSIKDFGIEVTKEDNILTLSTCANNYRDRIVLHAKKISL